MCTFVDQDVVLLNTHSNKYFALDEVGAQFWDLLRDGKQVNHAYKELLKEYEVASDQLEKDILELLDALMENGLVEITSG